MFKVVCMHAHVQRAFYRAMLLALQKKVSMYNLSSSSDTSDTVALAALCDSQLLISGKQLKVRLISIGIFKRVY